MAIDNYEYWEKTPRSTEYSWKKTSIRHHELSKLNVKCKNCGHTVFPTKERTICTYCGCWVYKNDKIEFKYKMLKNIKKTLI